LIKLQFDYIPRMSPAPATARDSGRISSWPGGPPPQVETEVFFPFILGDDHRVRGGTLAADCSHLRKQLAVARQRRRHSRLIACGRSSKQPDRERMVFMPPCLMLRALSAGSP